MNTMTFDPDTFMQQTIDHPLETSLQLVPEAEYQMMFDDFDRSAFGTAEWKNKNSGEDRSAVTLDLPCVILDENVKTALGRSKLTVPYRMFLDLTSEGLLDWGKDKNVSLGRARAAVGQNNPGPWSISQLRGAGPFMGRVKHVPDRKNPDNKRAQITHVTKIG